jgi:hypothetical protein
MRFGIRREQRVFESERIDRRQHTARPVCALNEAQTPEPLQLRRRFGRWRCGRRCGGGRRSSRGGGGGSGSGGSGGNRRKSGGRCAADKHTYTQKINRSDSRQSHVLAAKEAKGSIRSVGNVKPCECHTSYMCCFIAPLLGQTTLINSLYASYQTGRQQRGSSAKTTNERKAMNQSFTPDSSLGHRCSGSLPGLGRQRASRQPVCCSQRQAVWSLQVWDGQCCTSRTCRPARSCRKCNRDLSVDKGKR